MFVLLLQFLHQLYQLGDSKTDLFVTQRSTKNPVHNDGGWMVITTTTYHVYMAHDVPMQNRATTVTHGWLMVKL
jgi:hypothetical protein